MTLRVACFALASWLAVCWIAAIDRMLLAAEPIDPETVTVLKDIANRDGPSKAWRLDLAMPKGPDGKPRPAIVVIHGGGWLEGDTNAWRAR